jgi:hypothetical protein
MKGTSLFVKNFKRMKAMPPAFNLHAQTLKNKAKRLFVCKYLMELR